MFRESKELQVSGDHAQHNKSICHPCHTPKYDDRKQWPLQRLVTVDPFFTPLHQSRHWQNPRPTFAWQSLNFDVAFCADAGGTLL